MTNVSLTAEQANVIFGEKHGCMPLQKCLPYQWPLALDVLKRQYDALMSGRLLAFQSEYFERTQVGHTFEVKLLGRTGYFTTDPRNIAAIVSTNFEGKLPKICYLKYRVLTLKLVFHRLGTRFSTLWSISYDWRGDIHPRRASCR